MEFNRLYLIIISILGLLLLASYKFLYSVKLWGKIDGNFRYWYSISMLFAALGFIFMMIYMLVSKSFTNSDVSQLFITSLVIIIVSMLWMPVSLQYYKHPSFWSKSIIMLILLVVALAGLYAIIKIYLVKELNHNTLKIMAILGMKYFFFHTFVLDFITWPKNFF